MKKAKAPAAKVTLQALAYLPTYKRVEDIILGEELPLISLLRSEYFENEGYANIGTAEVTITLHSSDVIVQKQIDALNTQLAKQRADAHMAEKAILERISKLQALTFDGTVSEAA